MMTENVKKLEKITKRDGYKNKLVLLLKVSTKKMKNNIFNVRTICLFKKLLFTMKNATAADSSQSNISRLYIWKDNMLIMRSKKYLRKNVKKLEKSC